MERRGGQVHDQLCPGEGEIGGGWAGLPDVLADRRADQHVARAQEDQVAPCSEVPVLVEDAVVREEVLPVDTLQLHPGEHSAGVGEVAVEQRAADERRDPGRCARDRVERGAGRLDEAGAEEQILGRVPGDRELGEDHEVDAFGARVLDRADDGGAVAVQIADDHVQLSEREAHEIILPLSKPLRSRCFRPSVVNCTLPR